jgi:hypothetical protein
MFTVRYTNRPNVTSIIKGTETYFLMFLFFKIFYEKQNITHKLNFFSLQINVSGNNNDHHYKMYT